MQGRTVALVSAFCIAIPLVFELSSTSYGCNTCNTGGGRTALFHDRTVPAHVEDKRDGLKHRTVGARLTSFGDCMPYCDRTALKALIPEFVSIYKTKPFKSNLCGCAVNHCFSNFAVARLAQISLIVENGVNGGMSGYLFRAAKPNSEIWHVDPLTYPTCDPEARTRWKYPGPSKYLVGPGNSNYFQEMINMPNMHHEGPDALVDTVKKYD